MREDVGEGCTVIGRLGKLGSSLWIAALCHIEMSECLVKVVGTHTLGNECLSILELSVLNGEHAQIDIRFGCIGIDAKSLTQIRLCSFCVATTHGEFTEVVVGTVVVGEERHGLLQDSLLLCIAGGKDVCGIDEFFHAQLGGIPIHQLHDSFIAATNHIVVDDHAGTAQLWQHGISEFLIHHCHIAYFTLALFRVLIHGEHSQDDFLVLQI